MSNPEQERVYFNMCSAWSQWLSDGDQNTLEKYCRLLYKFESLKATDYAKATKLPTGEWL